MTQNAERTPREGPSETPDRQAEERLSRFSRADRFAWQAPAAEPEKPVAPAPVYTAHEPAAPLDAADPPWIIEDEPPIPAAPVAPPSPPPADAPLPLAGMHGLEEHLEALQAADSPAPQPEPSRRKLRTYKLGSEPEAKGAASTASKWKPILKAGARAGAAAARKTAAGISTAARVIRRRTRKQRLANDYTGSLIWLHTRLLDRKTERLFFHPTLDAERYPSVWRSLRRRAGTLFSGRKQQPDEPRPQPDPSAPLEPVVYDGPVPRLVFRWIMAALPADLKGYAFTDFRAHRGRAMMLASAYNFERIIGYEYTAAAIDDLQMNVAQYPRSLMACRNIECCRADSDGLVIPDQPAVLYFGQAHKEAYLSEILEHAAASYRNHPRRMYVILENAGKELDVFHGDVFCPVTPPGRDGWLLRLFSPVKVRIYRTRL
jgi:hypothetical protein